MLATKNLRVLSTILFVAWLSFLFGCTPAGPRALLDGKKLLEKGRYSDAVEKLTVATSLMKTNAQAWNYLGLACHRAGDPARAAKAYQQALVLDRELFEARFNLGCLLLEQGKADAAKSEFTACTLRRSTSVEAWLQLGAAQYRLNELAAAEESFHHALRLSANNPEAFNGLGLVNLQRKRPRDAAKDFALAVEQRPNYRSALLNLATVSHRHLNDPAGALRRYREYLVLEPRDTDWAAVDALARSLEQQLAGTTRATVAPPPVVPPTNAIAIRPAPSAITQSVSTIKTTAPPVVTKNPASSPPTLPPPEVVQLPPEPIIRTSPTTSAEGATQVAADIVPLVATNEPVHVSAAAAKSEKRGLISRLNPFHRDSKPATKSSATAIVGADASLESPTSAGDAPKMNSRYRYRSPATPPAGNRAEAERAFAQGTQAQRASRWAEAAQAFGRAVQLDGGYFEARYNLGLVQYALRNYEAALVTWEYALVTKPDSTEARYNFALTLKAAGFALDSAAELETILTVATNDVSAHLVLGNLYAEQLRMPIKARGHYQRVLDLDPRHPQANAIRYWMVANAP
jgi:tetratricopeptide (TPR) repeat protein